MEAITIIEAKAKGIAIVGRRIFANQEGFRVFFEAITFSAI